MCCSKSCLHFLCIYSSSRRIYHSKKSLTFSLKSLSLTLHQTSASGFSVCIFIGQVARHFMEQKMRMNRFFTVLSFLLLFPSIFFPAPEFLRCENLDPDEWLDPFAVSEGSLAFRTICQDSPSISSSCLCSEARFTRYYSLYYSGWNVYSHPFTSEMIFSVIERC